MKKSDALTVEEYLDQLAPEKRAGMEKLRALILTYLPEGYVESVNWGMISYEIPLDVYPQTYNKKPLNFAALAAQKNHFAVYLNNVYMNPELQNQLKAAFDEAGVRFDMGKSCLRLKDLEKAPLHAVGEVIAHTSPADFIAMYEAVMKK